MEVQSKIALPHHYQRWIWSLIFLIGLVCAFWLWGIPYVFGPTISVPALTRTDLTQTLVASGHIEAPFRASIGTQVSGVVANIPVIEGQKVAKGDVLVVLDDHEAVASVHDMEGQVAQAEARTRQIRELTLPSAEQALLEQQANLANVQQTFIRAQKLREQGVVTIAALDDASKNLEVARAQLRSGELLVFTNKAGGSDFVMAQTQLSQSNALLAAAKSRLSYYTIKAPKDGILIARSIEVGTIAQPGKELMSLSPTGDTQIIVQIDEKNLGLIKIGQQALASADAYAREKFAAQVVFINPAVDLARASVEVKLGVPQPPVYLAQDMTISVDIEVAQRANTLIIALADVHESKSAAPWVLIAEAGRAKRKAVSLGLVAAGKAEILSGLSEGDIIVPVSAKVAEGGRLRLASGVKP